MPPLKLTAPWFEAEFFGNACVNPERWRRQGSMIDGAQGVVMICPCGGHSLIVPFANPRNAPAPPPDFGPASRDGATHPRWDMSGTGLDDLTLQPSIDVGDERSCWHGFITNGYVR